MTSEIQKRAQQAGTHFRNNFIWPLEAKQLMIEKVVVPLLPTDDIDQLTTVRTPRFS